jgi:hypothetical protein
MPLLTSRDNPRVRRWRELSRDARTRRKEKKALIEGEHLVAAFLNAGGKVEALILSKSGRRFTPGNALRQRSCWPIRCSGHRGHRNARERCRNCTSCFSCGFAARNCVFWSASRMPAMSAPSCAALQPSASGTRCWVRAARRLVAQGGVPAWARFALAIRCTDLGAATEFGGHSRR